MNAPTRDSLLDFFTETSFLNAGSAPYIEGLADRYKEDPSSLPEEWRQALEEIAARPAPVGPGLAPASGAAASGVAAIRDTAGALALVNAFRTRGHFGARLDPLGLDGGRSPAELDHRAHGFTDADLDRPIFVDGVLGYEAVTLRTLEGALRERYCGAIGYEYMHIADSEQRAWLRERIEGRAAGRLADDERMALLAKLVEVKGYERYLDKKFVGTTRFGLDGAEATIPALEAIIEAAARHGVTEVQLGMAHRGRLSVMTHVLRKPHRAVFHEFRGGSPFPDGVANSGDVKYHMGASTDRDYAGKTVHLSLAANPSHLEIVDPVVLGKVRAKQDRKGDRDARSSVLPLLVHGDAAFAGQGVVSETFALSGLKGYRTGGSVHFIINNQIGFTTDPGYSRSTPYPSDVAKAIDAPIFHVNGDDPEAVVAVSRLALEYRQRFGTPVVIDMVCFRYYGHNEGDEPAFTQPAMYKAIRSHKSTLDSYAERLMAEGTVTVATLEEMKAAWVAYLDTEFAASESFRPTGTPWLEGRWEGLRPDTTDDPGDTSVAPETLDRVGKALTRVPDGFTLHPTVRRFVEARGKSIAEGTGIDWSTAEAFALGTLLHEGTPVRLSGQDTERGTFSQRHGVLIDQATGERHAPIASAATGDASFDIVNSPLSEEAALAFEYGYTLAEPHTLVLWEAQFGDFANGAQVVFDQFLSSAERKWLRMSGLVCLLPHGYDGQGPEHSSARLERFLQSAAEDNWQVANCTTPANYFHILRRQMRRDVRKPLILMTPKSLLRHRRSKSALSELGPGSSFQPLLRDDADAGGRTLELLPNAKIRRVVACSGKVYFDLLEEREKRSSNDVYLIRVEQLYPFPREGFARELARFPGAELVWCQEEPMNMGAWSFVEPILRGIRPPVYVGRPAAASPSVGASGRHQEETARFLAEAFA
ncbi:2-oxoglutarate dehydrogenase E1 component [Luteibacter yeojuensis]|uniref:oxoglutarate dehydrogenase (succinyl-transferring) n=1 Tax=Luteibacter yeojuensis TaxID=345309 RepID=A0A7X5QSG3_9GAMM|nr:2-oxoglutarate dehydrogenase E1 component [Luteibacter yeojuensis]